VAALAGEYHSVAARAAAAKADALGLPFLCSSAVLDALTDEPTEWVARLAPQSHGWQIYADFLFGAGHSQIAVATEPSVYWASGARILRDYLSPRGGTVIELDVRALAPTAVCDGLVSNRATALLLLVGFPEPAVSIVKSVRLDQRLAEIMIGAPAGQPEFAEWSTLLGDDGVEIPFLRYLPERLSPLEVRVETTLREGWPKRPPSSRSRATTLSQSLPTCCVLTGRIGRALPNPPYQFSSSRPQAAAVLVSASRESARAGAPISFMERMSRPSARARSCSSNAGRAT